VGEAINATHLARTTVRSLLEIGVNTFVLSPGSRNAPLSIALYEAEQRGLISLHTKIDERGAAFFALGIAKASNNYVAVVCTSGTAAANYHPAILEAHHSKNKLLVMTADRPQRLRGTGANQTTNQTNLFGDIKSHDISTPIELTSLFTGGPVHLNIQFDEPLLSSDSSDWLAGLQINSIPESTSSSQKLEIDGKTVVVIGHDSGTFTAEAIHETLSGIRIPVIAEDPLSHPASLAHASLFLADEGVREKLKADHIIVIGRTTLSRSINSFISSAVRTTVIDPRLENIDTHRSADNKFLALPEMHGDIDAVFFDLWKSASQAAHSELHNQQSFSEQSAVTTITENIPAGSALFIGSSRPIRDIEGFSSPRSGIKTFANRGLAGIDGNISTALGIAQCATPAYAILGDITFLHDISALISVEKSDLTIFVIDNNGGGIFSTLPQAGVAGFEKLFGTPHNLDIEKVVGGFGVQVERVKSSSDILRIINENKSGVRVVVVEVPAREKMAAELKNIYQRVSSAVRIGLNLA